MLEGVKADRAAQLFGQQTLHFLVEQFRPAPYKTDKFLPVNDINLYRGSEGFVIISRAGGLAVYPRSRKNAVRLIKGHRLFIAVNAQIVGVDGAVFDDESLAWRLA